MLLLSLGGEPPYHQALSADAGRVQELAEALGRLRTELDWRPTADFFERYAESHARAELCVPLAISGRKWQARILEVKDFLKSRMPRSFRARESGDGYVIRKLGWVMLDRELSRARALVRIGATEPVLSGQRERVLCAFTATSFDDEPPAPRPPPDFEFWAAISDEQQAWSHAQELVERGLELCAPPLCEPLGLGGHATLELAGVPLIERGLPAHPGWVEPSWHPEALVGNAALDIAGAIEAKPGADEDAVARVRERLADAAARAAAEDRAIVWWVGPTG